MFNEAGLRSGVLDTVLRDTSLSFWRRLGHGLNWAYGDAYQSVVNDSGVLPEQRSAKLLDIRFYRAEKAFHEAALEGGLVSSGQKIEVNKWNYTLVRGGGIALLQHYVHTPDDGARPACFRKKHAGLNGFLEAPQFPLGDVNPALFSLSEVYGFVIHGPVGQAFTEESQRLGFLHFAVMNRECSASVINIPVTEIVSQLEEKEAPEVKQRDVAKPELKNLPKQKEQG